VLIVQHLRIPNHPRQGANALTNLLYWVVNAHKLRISTVNRNLVTVQITHWTVTYPAIGNRFAMGWIPPTTTFYYGQRSKCADLPELLHNLHFVWFWSLPCFL